jgi:hypothetical protein
MLANDLIQPPLTSPAVSYIYHKAKTGAGLCRKGQTFCQSGQNIRLQISSLPDIASRSAKSYGLGIEPLLLFPLLPGQEHEI